MAEKEYIEKSAIRQALYHEAFETDTEYQRWDSGCWIRYKLFENVVDALPAAAVRPVKRGVWIDETYEVASHTGGVAVVHTGRVCCSECDEYEDYRRPFCPNCGADMRPEVHDEAADEA